MTFQFSFIWETLPAVLAAVPTTLLLTLFPAVAGLLIGFVLALIQMRAIPVLSQILVVLSSFFRSVPLLILLFLAYYGIPKLLNWLLCGGQRVWSTSNLSSLAVALLVITLYAGFFLGEILRGAFSSVDMRQMEAAHSIGMTKLSAYWRIVIPQAVIVALPNYFNFVLALLKGTSVVFTISVMDMMSVAKLSAEGGYRFIEAYTMVGILYVLFSVVFSHLFLALERRAKRHMGLDAAPRRS